VARAKAGSGFLLSRPRPRYELVCAECGTKWRPETIVLSILSHMRTDHDRNDLELLERRRVVE
jgi:hypothetical protein